MKCALLSAVLVLFGLWQGCLSICAGEGALVVVSLRQYQLQGPSNIHLYLYGLDGTMKKVLTKEPGLNDRDPIFSYDGKTILFTRYATDAKHRTQAGKYVLNIENGAIRPYNFATSEDSYNAWSSLDRFEGAFAEGSEGWLNLDSSSYLSPDGKFHITRTANPAPKGEGNIYFLSEGEGKPVPMESLPGFMPPDEIDGYESFLVSNGSPFISGGDFAAVFLRHHLGSTDGEQIWGLDLHARRWTKVSENGAIVYHPPSAAGVFVDTDERYQPLGKMGKTVNCSYLEWWDAHLKPSRLSPPLSVFYSAAVFHKAGDTVIIEDTDGS
jgi:hypothetical protein